MDPKAAVVADPVDSDLKQPINVSDVELTTSSKLAKPVIQQNLNEGGAREFLYSQAWPEGLQDVFMRSLVKMPYRFFICDDSGSMLKPDGKMLQKTKEGIPKLQPCTRWTELTEAMKFHVNLARAAHTPTEFRFLNNCPPIIMGTHDEDEARRYTQIMNQFNESPSGGTPLCRHIREITEKLYLVEDELRESCSKACIIITTDGQASDGDLVDVLAPLQALPVWLVIRLCTGHEKVVRYWNEIDHDLEIEMDVIDDLYGEAVEIRELNPWLSYAEPMQRLREFGVHLREIDLLDEAVLSLDQVRQISIVIYGNTAVRFPHPVADWDGFIAALQNENKTAPKVWNLFENRLKDWIDTKQLTHEYHGGGCCIIS